MAIEKHMLQTHSLFEKAGEVFDGVAKLKERIAELEAERDAFEKSFNEMTESFTQSQRALWLARAERAKVEQYAACGDGEIYLIWEKVERLCRKKADEFKEDV